MSTTREPWGDLPPHSWGDLTESTPRIVTEGSGLCHRISPRCPLPFSHRSSKNREAKAEDWRSCPEGREQSPGSTRSQGEEGSLSVHQGLPIPEQWGPHKGIIPHLVSPGHLSLCWLHPGEPPSGIRGTGCPKQRLAPMRSESTPQEETCKWPVSDRPACGSQLRPFTAPLSPSQAGCPRLTLASLLAVV